MWSDSLIKMFDLRIKVSGDDGGDDDPVDDPGTNNNPDDNPGDDDSGDDDEEDDDDPGDDPETLKKQIAKLRKENAKHRVNNKKFQGQQEKLSKVLKALGGEEDDETPERQLDVATQRYDAAVTRNAILEVALENGISGSENVEYFEFLMGKTLDSLDEGEEMTEEQLDEILEKCSARGAGAGKANTSTNGKGKGGKKAPGNENTDEVTQEEFDKMGMLAKSALYQKNQPLYEKLMANSKI